MQPDETNIQKLGSTFDNHTPDSDWLGDYPAYVTKRSTVEDAEHLTKEADAKLQVLALNKKNKNQSSNTLVANSNTPNDANNLDTQLKFPYYE